MKHPPIFLLFFCIAPLGAGAQVVDTAAVVQVVDSLILVSRSFANQGDFDIALEVNAIAEKLTLEKLGRETKSYGSTCVNHGRILYIKSDFPAAEKWCLESKNIREKILGKENADYAYSVHLLGNVIFDLGDFEKAEQLFLEAKGIRERVLGKKDSVYAWSLNNLANVNLELGNYEQCESFHLEAKAIREIVLGRNILIMGQVCTI